MKNTNITAVAAATVATAAVLLQLSPRRSQIAETVSQSLFTSSLQLTAAVRPIYGAGTIITENP